MGSKHTEAGTLHGEGQTPAAQVPITLGLIGKAMLCGFVGMVAYLPVLVGIPLVLDLFSTEPIVRFSSFFAFFGLEQSFALGIALYVLGGTLFLPVQFLVVGAYLPPEEPRFARGVTYALIYWTGFLLVFWPGGTFLANALFVITSLLYHILYGGTLGYLIDRWEQIPQHAV